MPLVKLSDLVTKPDHTYAVGAFNVSDMEMAMGAIRAAEEMTLRSSCRWQRGGCVTPRLTSWDL